MTAVRTAKQFLTYVNGGAVPAGDRRAGCGLGDDYFAGIAADLAGEARRAR